MCPRLSAFPANCSEEDEIEWNTYDTPELTGRDCPVFVLLHHKALIQAYSLYERGILPAAGGWQAQQEWWLQVFEVIGEALARVRRELDERARSEAAGQI